ncbi:MAG: hypothetical protein ACLVL6_13560 [Clostridium paraputrificum]
MSTINKLKKYIFGKKDLSDKDVKGLLISFSIPSILAIIVNGLYSVIDSIFVGRGVGEVAIGAIATSPTPLYWNNNNSWNSDFYWGYECII